MIKPYTAIVADVKGALLLFAPHYDTPQKAGNYLYRLSYRSQPEGGWYYGVVAPWGAVISPWVARNCGDDTRPPPPINADWIETRATVLARAYHGYAERTTQELPE